MRCTIKGSSLGGSPSRRPLPGGGMRKRRPERDRQRDQQGGGEFGDGGHDDDPGWYHDSHRGALDGYHHGDRHRHRRAFDRECHRRAFDCECQHPGADHIADRGPLWRLRDQPHLAVGAAGRTGPGPRLSLGLPGRCGAARRPRPARQSKLIDAYAKGSALHDAMSVAETQGDLAAGDACARWSNIQRRADDLAQTLYALREAAPDPGDQARIADVLASLQAARSAMDAELGARRRRLPAGRRGPQPAVRLRVVAARAPVP